MKKKKGWEGGGRTGKQHKGSTSVTVVADVWTPEPLNYSAHLFIIRQMSGNLSGAHQQLNLLQKTSSHSACSGLPFCQVAGRVAQLGGGGAPTFPTTF